MNRPTLSRAAALAALVTEWLVLIVLLALATPPIFIRHQILTSVPHLDLLDGSWILEAAYKAANGIWFGRDVAFTFGPLFQWLSSAPARWLGLSTGTIYATWYTLPLYVVILATFVSVRLLLPDASAWKRALLVLLAVVFWSPPDVRVSFCVLAFAIFVRLTDAAAGNRSWYVSGAVVAAVICVLGFLLSADTGIYSVAALLLCVAATMVTTRWPARLLKFLVVATLCAALLVVATNAVMLSPWDFRFWRSTLAIASAYRWCEPIAMAKTSKYLMQASFALAVVVFAVAWWRREPHGRWTSRPAVLISGFCLTFLILQTGLVRSDPGHVTIALYPIAFFCGAILLGAQASARFVPSLIAIALVAMTLTLSHAYPLFLPGSAISRWRQLVHPALVCPDGLQQFDGACFPEQDAKLLTGVSVYVNEHTNGGNRIAVFPYETAFGMTSRRTVAGGVMQTYLASGDYLTRLEMSGLQMASPAFGLYLPDGIYSVALDGVPNFTRSPDVWFWLVRHYRSQESPIDGVIGLARDNSPERQLIFFAGTGVAKPLRETPITKRSTALNLGQVHWPTAGGDFLKLRLRINYPWWWRVRKPSRLTLQMSFADGSEKSIGFIAEPNRDSDVWVYPWDERGLGNYFSGDESQWREPNRPALTGLRLLITPLDWISVVPSSITIEAVDSVHLSLGQ